MMAQKLKQRAYFILLFVAVALATFGLYVRYDNPPKIKIAVLEWPGFAPAVYADILGLYKKNNLPFEIVYSPGPAFSSEWLMNDQVDGIATVLTDLILMRANGTPAQAVLFTDYSMESDSIVARPEIKSVRDLKGKTIGIDALNSFSHVFVLKMLEKEGLSERDVFFKIVPFDHAAQALKNNEVQASHTWDPGLREALAAGYHRIAHAGQLPNVILDCMAFRQDLLKEYPEIFKKFIEVFYEAQRKMREDPKTASEKLQSFFNNDPVGFAKSFQDLHFIDEKENVTRWNPKAPDSFLREALKLNDFYLRRGQTNETDLHENAVAEGYYK